MLSFIAAIRDTLIPTEFGTHVKHPLLKGNTAVPTDNMALVVCQISVYAEVLSSHSSGGEECEDLEKPCT